MKKKRITTLGEICTWLQDEVGESRSESFERSIMNEDSVQVLKTLHWRISTLEGQNQELILRSEEREARISELEATEEEQLKSSSQLLRGKWIFPTRSETGKGTRDDQG